MSSNIVSAAGSTGHSTRERILTEALDLFAKSGYGGTSMRDLARQVGIRESSLYNHFPGKAAILEAIVDEHGPASSASRLEEPRYRALASKPVEFCRRFAFDLVEQWSDPREHQFQKVITAERNRVPGIRGKFADQFYSREQARMTDYFRGFALAELIETSDPREAARMFAAGLIYIRLEHYVMGAEASSHAVVIEAIERYLSFFLKLIAARSDGESESKKKKDRTEKSDGKTTAR